MERILYNNNLITESAEFDKVEYIFSNGARATQEELNYNEHEEAIKLLTADIETALTKKGKQKRPDYGKLNVTLGQEKMFELLRISLKLERKQVRALKLSEIRQAVDDFFTLNAQFREELKALSNAVATGMMMSSSNNFEQSLKSARLQASKQQGKKSSLRSPGKTSKTTKKH